MEYKDQMELNRLLQIKLDDQHHHHMMGLLKNINKDLSQFIRDTLKLKNVDRLKFKNGKIYAVEEWVNNHNGNDEETLNLIDLGDFEFSIKNILEQLEILNEIYKRTT